MYFIYFLIVLFGLLLMYQFYLVIKNRNCIEGMTSEYVDYNLSSDNPNSAMILSQQNAGNISYLKQRVDEVSSLKQTVDSLTQQVNEMSTQIDGLVQQQATFATQVAGDQPLEVTGTTETIE